MRKQALAESLEDIIGLCETILQKAPRQINEKKIIPEVERYYRTLPLPNPGGHYPVLGGCTRDYSIHRNVAIAGNGYVTTYTLRGRKLGRNPSMTYLITNKVVISSGSLDGQTLQYHRRIRELTPHMRSSRVRLWLRRKLSLQLELLMDEIEQGTATPIELPLELHL
ncbi:MAG TPA: hypothetical protein VMR75_01425 [Candidatus Saccharimonadales bacterium]|nr:hypothetical protein [Candidatus Saccharimonadales bacterium]